MTVIDHLAKAATNILVARTLVDMTIRNLVLEIGTTAPTALIAVVHLGETTTTIISTTLPTPLCLLNHHPCF